MLLKRDVEGGEDGGQDIWNAIQYHIHIKTQFNKLLAVSNKLKILQTVLVVQVDQEDQVVVQDQVVAVDQEDQVVEEVVEDMVDKEDQVDKGVIMVLKDLKDMLVLDQMVEVGTT